MVFLPSVALTGCDKVEMTDAEYVLRARDYQDKGDLRSSSIELRNALRQNPNNAEARWLLGNIYLELGNGAPAEKELLRARKLGVGRESITPPLGDALLLQRKFREVLQQIRAEGTAKPRNLARILRIRGDAELGLGNLASGCALFLQARDTASDYAPAYLGLARCALARKEDPEKAKALLEEALTRDPKFGDAWLLMGRMERAQGRFEAAEMAFTKAIEANRRDPVALFEHAGLALTMEDLDAFRGDLATFRKRHPRHPLVNYLQALLDVREGRLEAARDNLQILVNERPEHLPSQALLGAVNLDLGLAATAEEGLKKVVAKAPGNRPVRRLLAQAQLKTGQPEKALKTLRPLLSVEMPEAGDLTLAGEAYLRSGDIARAKLVFASAQGRAPDDARAQLNLARASLADGEMVQALENLEIAAEIDPSRTSADKLLVLTHLSTGQYDKALEAAKRLVGKTPDSALAYHLEGAAYLGKKDLAAARQAFEKALSIDPGFDLPLLKLTDIDVLEDQPEQARQRLEKAVTRNPGHYRLMLALARLSQQMGDQTQTKAWVEKAAAADPGAVEPLESLIPLLIAENRATRALTLASEAVQNNPTSPKALELLAMAQMAAGDREAGLATFKRLVALLPDKAGSHFRLGQTLMLTGRYDAARESLLTALRLAPDSLEVQATLGVLENHVRHWTEATRIARDIQRSHPKSPTGYLLEGDIALARGRAAEALAPYETAFVKARTGKALLRLVRAMDATGRGTKAEARLLDWLKTHPNDGEVRGYLANDYDQTGKLQEAIDQYEILLRLFPKDGLIMNNLASLYQRAGDTRARRTAEQAFKLQPDHPATLDTLGWMLIQQGEAKRGLELLGKAVALAPKNREVGYHYAKALAVVGEKEQARKALRSLLAAGPFPQEGEARALLDRL